MPEFTPVYLPQSGPNDITATIAEWSKPAGRQVQRGEVVGVAETTKSVLDLEAPTAGLFWPLAGPGAEVSVGAIVAAVGGEASSQATAAAWLAQQAQPDAATKAPAAAGAARIGTLKAQLLAQRHGIELAQVPSVHERITEADVQSYLAAQAAAPSAVPAAPANAPVTYSVAPAADELRDLVEDRYPYVGPQRLLIIGGGNGAIQILDALAKLPHQRAVAILDDNPAIHGKSVAGVPVLGAIDVARAVDMAAARQIDAAVISISTSIAARTRIFEQWKSRGLAFANVVHSSCVIGMNVHWGEGNVVMALCHFGACATIGDNNFLSAYCSIEHHCVLGRHCSFGPAVVTSSRVQIEDGVRFGSGIYIEPGIRIGAGSVIASGLAITQHIAPQSLLKAHTGYSIRTRSLG